MSGNIQRISTETIWGAFDSGLDNNVRGLCVKPYTGHSKGCPNYGKKATCPHKAPLLSNVLKLNETVYVAWNRFDFGLHVGRMREKHPDWSERQLSCCLYWQGTARKALRISIEAFLKDHTGMVAVTTPEACGVDVTLLMKRIGIKLEWPPVLFAYQVALLGTPVIDTESGIKA